MTWGFFVSSILTRREAVMAKSLTGDCMASEDIDIGTLMKTSVNC